MGSREFLCFLFISGIIPISANNNYTLTTPAEPEAPKGPTDKEIAATGRLTGPATIEVRPVGYEYEALFHWRNYAESMDHSKIKWIVSDNSKVRLRNPSSKRNDAMYATALKAGNVTITLTYAGYTVGAWDITVYERPKDWVYWEIGCSRKPERYAEIKKFNESINSWVAENITDDMSEYDKAYAAAYYIKNYMVYDINKSGNDLVRTWNACEGGVCGHSAGMVYYFLTKMGIDNTTVFEDWNNQGDIGDIGSLGFHASNWAMCDGQAYHIDAVFRADDNKNWTPLFEKTSMTKSEADATWD